MEGLAALLTVPNCASLVYLVLANDALLGAWRQFLDKKGALLGQVAKLTQEILVVVLNFSLVAFVFPLFLVVLNLLLCLWGSFFDVLDVGRSWTELGPIFKLATSLATQLHAVKLVLDHLFKLFLLPRVHHIFSILSWGFTLLLSLFEKFSIVPFWLTFLSILTFRLRRRLLWKFLTHLHLLFVSVFLRVHFNGVIHIFLLVPRRFLNSTTSHCNFTTPISSEWLLNLLQMLLKLSVFIELGARFLPSIGVLTSFFSFTTLILIFVTSLSWLLTSHGFKELLVYLGNYNRCRVFLCALTRKRVWVESTSIWIQELHSHVLLPFSDGVRFLLRMLNALRRLGLLNFRCFSWCCFNFPHLLDLSRTGFFLVLFFTTSLALTTGLGVQGLCRIGIGSVWDRPTIATFRYHLINLYEIVSGRLNSNINQ